MTHFAGPDFFWPYDSDQELYREKIPPELGLIPSKWRMPLSHWRFFHAENRDLVPLGFSTPDFDDSSWLSMDVPSSWQLKGYGIPTDLTYDEEAHELELASSKRFSTLFSRISSGEYEDDVGVYRTVIQIPEEYLGRAVYFGCAGIRGRFEMYVNGHYVAASPAIYTHSRFYLSPFLAEGANVIVLLVFHLDGHKHVRQKIESGTFGMSGIFRLPELIAESLLEISSVAVETTWEATSISGTSEDGLSFVNDNTSEDFIDVTGQPVSADPWVPDRRSASAHVRIRLKNHTDLMTPVRVTASLLEARAEYDLYDLPVHVPVAFDIKGTIPGVSDLELEADFSAKNIWAWSDQKPILYDLVFYLLGSHGQLISVKRIRFGFKTSSSIGRVFHINDVALPIRAVRYFSFDPKGGISLSPERMRQDIFLMKRAGINTILGAHFPADPLFYRMCDHYGMMIIAQDDRHRIRDTVLALSMHPSIVMWSFAPRHYDERKWFLGKQKLLLQDATRPFYCEKDSSGAVSDMLPFPNDAGTLFGEWCDLALFKEPLQRQLGEGESIFSSIKGRAVRETDLAPYRFVHQGDLEEYHDKSDVPIAQGIVSADRIPHPIYLEIKKQCETIQITPSSEATDSFTITNLHPFGETRDTLLEWKLMLDGYPVKGGRGNLGSIPPLGDQKIMLPIRVSSFLEPGWMNTDPRWTEISRRAVRRELVLLIRLSLRAPTAYVDEGHELAFYQQVLLERANASEASEVDEKLHSPHLMQANNNNNAMASAELLPAGQAQPRVGGEEGNKTDHIEISTKPDNLIASLRDLAISFSRFEGSLDSLQVFGRQFLRDGILPSLYRAATNSDRSDQAFALAATIYSRETDWRDVQDKLASKRFHYEMDGANFCLLSRFSCRATKGDILLYHELLADGSLRITVALTPRYDLLRCGIRLRIPREFCHLQWYGRGPAETYKDRKESGIIGRFSSHPENMSHDYARPQESGGRESTRYLLVADKEGYAIRIEAGEGEFLFTASLHDPRDIDDHMHQEELPESDAFNLFLDFYHRGIERTGKESRQFKGNQMYRGTFLLTPCRLDDQGSL